MTLTWRRAGADWVLFLRGHRFGRVVPDNKYPGMWRSTLSGGRLSDMTNLAWAKNAVLVAAERELEWAARTNTPPKCQEKEVSFEGPARPADFPPRPSLLRPQVQFDERTAFLMKTPAIAFEDLK